MNPEPQNISLPIPAIVLAVGDFAKQMTQQVSTIYLRGDERRSIITSFYSVEKNEAGILGLVPLETKAPAADAVSSEQTQSSNAPTPNWFKRRNWFRDTIKSAKHLLNELQQALHETRAHERLIRAGWMEVYDVPTNFYLVLDAKDPAAAGAAMPILALLQEVIASTNLCQAHVLINAAVFPRPLEDKIEQQSPHLDLEVYTFMQELDCFLHVNAEERIRLQETLGLQYHSLLELPVYLFDLHKEGVAVVKDQGEMQVMIGNALMALLQRDLARQLRAQVDELEAQDQHCVYHSIGSAGIIYDPASLQEAVASRVAYEFLEQKILSNAADAQTAQTEADQIASLIGDLGIWLEMLTFQLSPAIGQITIEPGTFAFDLLLTNLNLEDLDYEHIHATAWAKRIKEYDSRFHGEIYPQVLERFIENAQSLNEQTAATLAERLYELPISPRMYPGGLDTADRVLDTLENTFAARKQKVEALVGEVTHRQGIVSQQLTEKLGDIQSLLDQAPQLPRLIRILPRFLRDWLAPIYYVRKYGRQIYLLRNLREECTDLLQQKCAESIQVQALEHLKAIIDDDREILQASRGDLETLQEKINKVRDSFSSSFGVFPLGQESNGWLDIFRVPAVDENLADWAYAKWYPDLDRWITLMFVDSGLFEKWQSVTEDAITDWLDQQAKECYAKLWDLSLENIFELWADTKTGFTSIQPLSRTTIRTCINASSPLLRPDFDASGGSGISTVSNHELICQPEWSLCQVPENLPGKDKWRVVYTGDPYLALFIQVRHAVSLMPLIEMLQHGKHKDAELEENERQHYKSLGALDPDPPITETLDPDDPDVIKKVFRWKFQPRGSGEAIEQEITLYLSKSRYEYYRRQPRFSGEWNRYAETEMPEVRMLATEFQKMHTENKWSTFNQAFNVLKFVQACIPYSFDKDSTGHSDWARYPIESLMEGTGDCEDVAILCAAIIARLGFQVVLLTYPKHIAFGVAGAEKLKGEYIHDPATGRYYFYGEATADGWHLGQIPKEYRELKPEQIQPVNILIEEEFEAF